MIYSSMNSWASDYSISCGRQYGAPWWNNKWRGSNKSRTVQILSQVVSFNQFAFRHELVYCVRLWSSFIIEERFGCFAVFVVVGLWPTRSRVCGSVIYCIMWTISVGVIYNLGLFTPSESIYLSIGVRFLMSWLLPRCRSAIVFSMIACWVSFVWSADSGTRP